jgi:hypothetical protein
MKERYIMLLALLLMVAVGKGETVAEAVTTTEETTDTLKVAEVATLSKKDSLSMVKTGKKIKQKRDWTTWKPDPKRALWLALVLPGAGQIYNRKYWKLPIIYGGFIGCIYALTWNNQMYQDYAQAYADISDSDPNTRSYEQFLHLGVTINDSNKDQWTNTFKNRKDQYRRWRDLSFFVMLGVYALSVIDAYVDASMSKFDISDDLSLRIGPAVVPGHTRTLTTGGESPTSLLNTTGVGVRGALTF